MYILFKRHNLDDNERIIGVFDDKEIALKKMNELFSQGHHCYSVVYYPLNELNIGVKVACIVSDYEL